MVIDSTEESCSFSIGLQVWEGAGPRICCRVKLVKLRVSVFANEVYGRFRNRSNNKVC